MTQAKRPRMVDEGAIDAAIDPARFRRKVFVRWAKTPYALAPTAAGAALLAAGVAGAVVLAPATAALTAFAGVCGLLAGGGAYATKWLLGADAMAKKAALELAAEQRQARDDAVAALLKRLLRDDDPRTQALLRRLRDLHHRVADPNSPDRLDAPANVVDKVRQVYESCLSALARTANLVDTATRLTTDAGRRQAMATREALVQEVGRATADLDRVVGQVEALVVAGGTGGTAELSAMREELNRSLDVARRVEERVGNIERGMPDELTE